MDHKECNDCKIIKPIDQFYTYKDRHGKTRLDRSCKDCTKTRLAKYKKPYNELTEEQKIKRKKSIADSQARRAHTTIFDDPNAKKCSKPDCFRVTKAKGLCRNHYNTLKKKLRKKNKPKKIKSYKYGKRLEDMNPEERKAILKQIAKDYRKSEKGKAARKREYANPANKAMRSCRMRIIKLLADKGERKTHSVTEWLGCTKSFLKEHIEKQFYPHPTLGLPMTWENHGFGDDKWHIEHIYPLSVAYKEGPEAFKKAQHYTNIRPMWQPENLSKYNKIENETT